LEKYKGNLSIFPNQSNQQNKTDLNIDGDSFLYIHVGDLKAGEMVNDATEFSSQFLKRFSKKQNTVIKFHSLSNKKNL